MLLTFLIQESMLTLPMRPPHLQCSTVFVSFGSAYWILFRILENGPNFIFFLYNETMPPQIGRDHVHRLLLPQSNFQRIKFSIWLKFGPFFQFKKKIARCTSNVWLTPKPFSAFFKYMGRTTHCLSLMTTHNLFVSWTRAH